jgi:hypothetical protein
MKTGFAEKTRPFITYFPGQKVFCWKALSFIAVLGLSLGVLLAFSV